MSLWLISAPSLLDGNRSRACTTAWVAVLPRPPGHLQSPPTTKHPTLLSPHKSTQLFQEVRAVHKRTATYRKSRAHNTKSDDISDRHCHCTAACLLPPFLVHFLENTHFLLPFRCAETGSVKHETIDARVKSGSGLESLHVAAVP